MKKKLLIFIIILFFVISINTIVTAKYVIEAVNTVGTLNIDRKPPITTVMYSTIDPTDEEVLVTIKSDEIIRPVEGWSLSINRKELTKSYKENIREIIKVVDLVGNSTDTEIVIENIDKEKPKIQLINIENTNEKYPKYANYFHEITFQINIIEDNIIINELVPENLQFKLNNENISPENINISPISEENKNNYYIKVSGISGNGILSIIIKDSIIMDIGNRWNEETKIESGILIDNEKPEIEYNEELLENQKSKITIISNEKIRSLDGWKINNEADKLEKEFTNNVSFDLKIEDYAENETMIEIDVSKATYITLTYCSHNSEVGWSYGYGNNDIAGIEAINKNPLFKTEVLAFNIEGNVDSDFVQGRSYVYTHWGENVDATCRNTGIVYNGGYNPKNNTYKTMKNDAIVTLNNKKYFQFGGCGINLVGKRDINGENPIPLENTYTYNYGISGIEFKLKDYSYYSIVYQIFVADIGWLQPKSNGEMAMYKKEKPISAFRISLIPNTEKNALIELWSK